MIFKLHAAAGLLLTATVAFGQTSIEQVAPKNSVVVIGVRDVTASLERLEGHPLLALWQGRGPGPGAVDDVEDMLPEELNDLLRTLGLNEGRFPRPQGAAGVALFTTMNDEMGMREPAFMALVDFGDEAALAHERFTTALRKGGEAGLFTSEKKDLDTGPVWTIRITPKAPEAGDEGWGDADPFMMMPQPGDLLSGFDTVHFTQAGTVMLAGSDLPALVKGVRGLGGGGAAGLAATAAFQGAIGQVGRGDVYATVITANLPELAQSMDPMGLAMAFTPTVRAVFGRIDALAWAVDLAGGRFRNTLSALMPAGKSGLPALHDTPLAAVAPPDFVPGDVVSYLSFSFEFDRVIPFVQTVIDSNMMIQQNAGPGWQEWKQKMEPILARLGAQVHLVGRAGDGREMGPTFLAIECTAPDEMDRILGDLAVEEGLVRGEVAGRPVFTGEAPIMPLPMPGMMANGAGGRPMSIGVGREFLFLGGPDAVEAALAPAGADRGLAADPDFRRALATMPREGVVAWGYSNTRKLADMASRLNGGPDLEPARREAMAEWLERLMGPTVWHVRSTEDGFVGSMYGVPTEQAVQAD